MLALQRTAGNRAVGQVLARKGAVKPTVKFGKHSIVVSGGNVRDWAKEVQETLTVTSEKGKHSAELARLAKAREKIPLLTLTMARVNPEGQDLDIGSIAFEIKNGRIKNYSLSGKTESWQLVDFTDVHRTTITHKIGAG